MPVLGHPHSPIPPPRDFLRATASEVLGPGELFDVGVEVPVEFRVFPAPVGFEPQDLECRRKRKKDMLSLQFAHFW